MTCEPLDKLFRFITMLGDHGWIWICIACFLLINEKTRRTGIRMLLGMLLGFIMGNLILKNLLRRSRPVWIDKSVSPLIKEPIDYSFPSGHTLSSFIAALTIYRKNKKFGVPALILASLIAFSRLYLFVHFPTDVIGAIALALLITPAAEAIEKKFLESRTSGKPD